MKSQSPLPLPFAQKLAERILAELAPFCVSIEIAGSIRRRRPWVNDIDIVALPAPGQRQALIARAELATTRVRAGDCERVLRLKNGVQLDLWLAAEPVTDLLDSRPTNYGSLLLCRTGSAAHNIYLVEHAKRMGLRWNPHHGVYDPMVNAGRHGLCIAAATEQEIFTALKLPFIPPEERER